MVDMHPRMPRPTIHYQINEPLECPFLISPIYCPAAIINGRTAGVCGHHAEQILAPSMIHERVGLQVEKDVTGRRLRQQAESMVRIQCQNFMNRRLLCPSVNLDPSLLPNADVTFRGASLWALP